MKTEDKLKDAISLLGNRWQGHPNYVRALHPQHPVIVAKYHPHWPLPIEAVIRQPDAWRTEPALSLYHVALAIIIACTLLSTLDWMLS